MILYKLKVMIKNVYNYALLCVVGANGTLSIFRK